MQVKYLSSDSRLPRKTEAGYLFEEHRYGVSRSARARLEDALQLGTRPENLTIKGLPVNVDQDSIAAAIASPESWCAALEESFQLCITMLVQWGATAFEVIATDDVRSMAAYYVDPETLRRRWGRCTQRRHGGAIDLRDRLIVLEEMPRFGRRRWNWIVDALVRAPGAGKPIQYENWASIDFTERHFNAERQARLAPYVIPDVLSDVGWLASFEVADEFTPFYVAYRWLRFQRFACDVRDAAHRALDQVISAFGKGFRADLRLECAWPNSAADYDRAMEAWRSGSCKVARELPGFPNALFSRGAGS